MESRPETIKQVIIQQNGIKAEFITLTVMKLLELNQRMVEI